MSQPANEEMIFGSGVKKVEGFYSRTVDVIFRPNEDVAVDWPGVPEDQRPPE